MKISFTVDDGATVFNVPDSPAGSVTDAGFFLSEHENKKNAQSTAIKILNFIITPCFFTAPGKTTYQL